MKPPEKYRPTTDHYRDVDLMTLAKECARLSLRIRERKQRAREERLELADAASDALVGFSRRLEPHAHVPEEPENAARRDSSVSKAFGDWYERIKERERARVLKRASWWALWEDAKHWLSQRIGDETTYARRWVGVNSDEGLVEVLRALDAFPRRTQ
jgi:hypothetical protein